MSGHAAGHEQGQTYKVDIQNFAYQTKSLTIAKGDSVTFTNLDEMEHTATSDNGAFDSGYLKQYESFTYTFDETGTFDIYCKPHPFMTIQIIVE